MPEILDAIRENGLALVSLVIVSGFLYVVLRAFHKELTDRRLRAETLTDRMMDAFDGLEAATQTAVAVAKDNAEVARKTAELAQQSLDELRRR